MKKYWNLFFCCMLFGAGLFLKSVHEIIVTVTCNSECQAQLLYKNSVFFDVQQKFLDSRNSDYKIKDAFSGFPHAPDILHDSGIDILAVTESGEVFLVSRISALAMLATPSIKDDKPIWRCKFFTNESVAPDERQCSF